MPPLLEQKYRQLRRAIDADRKKAAVLGVLGAVLLGLWVKSMWPEGGVAAAVAGAAGGGASSAETSAADQAPPGSPAVRAWLEGAIDPIGRNLFAPIDRAAPPDPARLAAERRERVGQTFWEGLDQALARRADQKRRREERALSARQDAALLRLEATWMGGGPAGHRAVINGKLLRPGEGVSPGKAAAPFRVRTIEPQRVVVERDGVRVELKMGEE